MTWCGLLPNKTHEQAVFAEALRSTGALDGVRTMLEDRRRLQQRSLELGSRHIEVCLDDLSSSSSSAATAWSRLGRSLNLELKPNSVLEQAHSSRAGQDVDQLRARLGVLADGHLRNLLRADLLAEYPKCGASQLEQRLKSLGASALSNALTREGSQRLGDWMTSHPHYRPVPFHERARPLPSG